MPATTRRVSLRTLGIMAATVAAAGGLAAPSVASALDTDTSGSIEPNPAPTEPIIESPIAIDPERPDQVSSDLIVAPAPEDTGLPEVTNSLPEIDFEWQNDEYIGLDWDDCPGCGMG